MNKNNLPIETIELIQLSIKEYIDLCDCLMDYSSFSHQEKSNWVGHSHGKHICYQHKTTAQIVEAPYSKIKKRADLDTYFWLVFVKSTSKFKELTDFITLNKGIEQDLLSQFCDNKTFENRALEIPEFKVGEFIQLRDSAYKADFHMNAHWELKYFYEDQLQHIYWPIEQNFDDYGCQLPTILGGTKSQIKEIIWEDSVISKIHTDLFILDMPLAYEKNQFQRIERIENYCIDESLLFLIDQLSFFEHKCRDGTFRPAERENNKIRDTQQYFEIMKRRSIKN